MSEGSQQPPDDFLNPDITRGRLIAASVYVASFDSLKDAIVSRIRELFWRGFDQDGEKIDPRYASEVLSRNRSSVYASLQWLRENRVIVDADIETFDRIRACRNRLSHELLSLVADEGLPSGFNERFAEMLELLRKIEVWWVINFELPTSLEFAKREVDPSTVVPGRLVALQVLMDVALGDEERSWYYYRELKRRTGRG